MLRLYFFGMKQLNNDFNNKHTLYFLFSQILYATYLSIVKIIKKLILLNSFEPLELNYFFRITTTNNSDVYSKRCSANINFDNITSIIEIINIKTLIFGLITITFKNV